MKKLILSASFAFALLATSNTFAQQGFGTNTPDKSAAVDIVSSKRGLLIPRVALRSTDSNSLQSGSIANPAHSLFVYNTATAGTGETAVTPGFYYWERDDASLSGTNYTGKWVRFVSSNIEKNVVVAAGENVQVAPTTSSDGLTTTYTVGVQGGNKEGQVLVTKVTGIAPDEITTTEWVDPNEFVAGIIKEGNGINFTTDTDGNPVINLGSADPFNEDVTLNTGKKDLIIEGLDDVSTNYDGADTDRIVIMDPATGVLKIVSPKALIKDAIEYGDLEAKTLAGAGITVTAGITEGTNANVSVADVVLKDIVLGIADRAITSEKMNSTVPGADPADPRTNAPSGQVPVADGNGGVTYQNVATAIGQDLTTDGKILIQGGTNDGKTLEDAVLVATHLSIAEGSIELDDIKPGKAGEIMVTDENEEVSWKTLGGDVTGGYNDTKVVAIQGTDVSATAPTATNNVLVYDDATKTWVPTALDGSHITGAALTSNSITVTSAVGPTNTALLEALAIEITPAATAGLVLTTTEVAGDKVTTWEKPNTSYSTTDVNIADDTNYSPYIAEIVLEVTLAGADQTVEFPVASAANEGQTISIKIANTDENHDGYLNVLDTYGTMPYQGWIVKSNGSKWLIVGRN